MKSQKLNKMEDTPLVLIYPDKDRMPLSFALDGHFAPEILAINEQMLADILCEQIEDEISERDSVCNEDRYLIKNPNDYDLIYTVKKEPFKFDVDIDFSTIVNPPGCIYPGRSVRIDSIGIEASWMKKEMAIKLNKELLISSLEMIIHIAR